MPVYAYQCSACHHAFEARQSFADDALSQCPQCHQPTLRKKFGTVGVAFKGAGFYSTDARSAGSSSGSSTSSSSTD